MRTLLLTILIVAMASPALAANRALYVALREQRKAALWAAKQQILIDRERAKTQEMLLRIQRAERKRYEAIAAHEERKKSLRMEPIERREDGFMFLPKNQNGLAPDQH